MNPRALHFGAMAIDLRDVVFTAELLVSIPPGFARRFRVLPVASSPDKLLVALADPSDLGAIDSLRELLQRDLELCLAEPWQLDELIERLYGDENKL